MKMDPAEEIIDEYLKYLADRDVYRAPTVLSWFTDYIDTRNENAIYKLLQHTLASEAVAGLVDLLEFDDEGLTESVVHILGTIVEHPRCRQYVLEVPRNTATSGQNNPTLFTALVNMLMSEDKNVVMNAAGTVANIAESPDGRLWILQQAAFDDALPILGVLTVDPHQWAASNSALVIARLTLSQEGIVKILSHERASFILTNLCVSLCGHNPGSSMNAAFAVGRLLEREDARSKLLAMKNFKNTMTALTKMLYNKESGPRKNACFAFSCLANSKEGHSRLLGNVNSELILDQLVRLITDPDDETAWFAAVTLRAVSSQKEGVFRLRDHKSVFSVLKKLVKETGGIKLKSDLLKEVKLTVEILGKLPKLPPPILTSVDEFSVSARWDSVIATPGSKIAYQLYQGCTCVYQGSKTSVKVRNLKPFTSYVFRIRATNSSDEGPYSGPALITTNEGVPGPPADVTSDGKPLHSSVKITWTRPPSPNGTLTGYNIYANGERVAVVGTDKQSYTIRDQPHSKSLVVQIAATTKAGEGEKSTPITCSTLNLSDFPPKKPILSTSGGSNEIHVSWIDPPKQLGLVDHYELVMNGEVVYSGKEQGHRVSNLEPLKEYTFNIRVVTADGYVIESEPAKKKAGSKVVSSKNGQNDKMTDDESELIGPQEFRSPSPDIAKSVSENREIIRPKKKKDRFAVRQKPVCEPRHNLETIQEGVSQGPSPDLHEGVSEVIVRKQNGPPHNSPDDGTGDRITFVPVYQNKSEGESSDSLLHMTNDPTRSSETMSSSSPWNDSQQQEAAVNSLASIKSLISSSNSDYTSPANEREAVSTERAAVASHQANNTAAPRVDEDQEALSRVRSLSDIKLREAGHRRSQRNDMTADHENDSEAGDSLDYKRDRSRFNIDEVRKKDGGIEEQNRLISAMISQRNSESLAQNKRTKDIMENVRSDMRNSIQSKRDSHQPTIQVNTVDTHRGNDNSVSSNRFLNDMNSPRKDVKLSSVNMMFGDVADTAPRHRTVNVMQVKKASQIQKKPKRRKKAATLPPLERTAPIPNDLGFHFPKL